MRGRSAPGAQAPTVVSLGAVSREWDSGWGNLIFAERHQVSDNWFWETHCKKVAVTVQCTNNHTHFAYPGLAAKSQRVRVDPRDGFHRQDQLDSAIGPISRALETGKDVLLHCNQSFHRAPVIGAAVCARVSGVSAKVPSMNKNGVGSRLFFLLIRYCSYSVRLGEPFN